MADGRYQALDIAWDSRPAAAGGQRWFHLRGDEVYEPGDPLHWTGVAYNWNFMCADCHSTAFRKNFDPATNTYESSFAEIDVSCEACHGPGSAHAEWAAARPAEAINPGAPASLTAEQMGLVVPFPSIADVAWPIDPETGLATRVPPRREGAEVETCGRCHARRGPIVDDYGFGGPLTDSYRVSLLDPGLYHDDGQILDEVYVYGSFVPKPHVSTGGLVQRLPRAAQPEAQQPRQRPVCPLPPCREVRQRRASPSRGKYRGCGLYLMSHAGDDLHGRRPAPGPQLPPATAGPERRLWHPERLQWLSCRRRRPLGGRRGSRMVWAR